MSKDIPDWLKNTKSTIKGHDESEAVRIQREREDSDKRWLAVDNEVSRLTDPLTRDVVGYIKSWGNLRVEELLRDINVVLGGESITDPKLTFVADSDEVVSAFNLDKISPNPSEVIRQLIKETVIQTSIYKKKGVGAESIRFGQIESSCVHTWKSEGMDGDYGPKTGIDSKNLFTFQMKPDGIFVLCNGIIPDQMIVTSPKNISRGDLQGALDSYIVKIVSAKKNH